MGCFYKFIDDRWSGPSLVQRKFGRSYRKNWITLRAGLAGIGGISAMPNTSLHISEVTRTSARRSSLEKDSRNT